MYLGRNDVKFSQQVEDMYWIGRWKFHTESIIVFIDFQSVALQLEDFCMEVCGTPRQSVRFRGSNKHIAYYVVSQYLSSQFRMLSKNHFDYI